MGREALHKPEEAPIVRELEAKLFVDRSTFDALKARLENGERIPVIFDGRVKTVWFSVPKLGGHSMSARIRITRDTITGKKKYYWTIKKRIAKKEVAEHIKESLEYEGVASSKKEAKGILFSKLGKLYRDGAEGYTQKKSEKQNRVVKKLRTSFRTNDLSHPLCGVRFDFDTLCEVGKIKKEKKRIDPPIYILEIEGLSEGMIQKAAHHLNIDPQRLSSVSTSTLLRDRGLI